MYTAKETRYNTMRYFRCGKSGLKLPGVSLGFWHNFGDTGCFKTMEQICFTAFDHGITHFIYISVIVIAEYHTIKTGIRHLHGVIKELIMSSGIYDYYPF